MFIKKTFQTERSENHSLITKIIGFHFIKYNVRKLKESGNLLFFLVTILKFIDLLIGSKS